MWKSPKCQARCAQFESILGSLQHPLLLIIRLYWGWSFFQAGWGKLSHIDKVIESFVSMGLPAFNAYLVASFETVGGLLLILGLLSRFIAIPLVVIMIVALCTAHAEATFNLLNDPQTFFEQEAFLHLYASLLVMIFGAGKWSLDHCCCGKSCRTRVEL